MLDPSNAFISAYLKGEESKLITLEHIDKMLSASSIRDILEIIKGSDIGDYLQGVPINTFDDIDACLWKYLLSCIEHIESFNLLPDDIRRILRAYLVKYDISNVKAALWGISSGKKARMMPLGAIQSYGMLDRLSHVENIDGIIELLTECRLGDYAPILKEYEIEGEIRSRLMVEARLDSEYYKNMLGMANDTQDGFILAKAFGVIIDLTNLQITSRAIIEGIGTEVAECTISGGYIISEKTIRELLPLTLADIPHRLENTPYHEVARELSDSYDRTKSITSIEETIDKYEFRLLKGVLSTWVLSPLVVAWYLILKENEIRNLRLVIKMIFDSIPLSEIKDYLVLSS